MNEGQRLTPYTVRGEIEQSLGGGKKKEKKKPTINSTKNGRGRKKNRDLGKTGRMHGSLKPKEGKVTGGCDAEVRQRKKS